MHAAIEARRERDVAEAERDALQAVVDKLQAKIERLHRIEQAAKNDLDAVEAYRRYSPSRDAAEDVLRIALGGIS